MSFLGIKTRSDYKKQVASLKEELNYAKLNYSLCHAKYVMCNDIINKLIIGIPTEKLVNIEHGCEIRPFAPENLNQKANVTLYTSDDCTYMYLSKKLTEGYTHLALGFCGPDYTLSFWLNNEGVGMEIDSNNRVKDKLIMLFLKQYFDIEDDKKEIFFKKMQ